MHESTVSRAVRDKYVETPHGTFELRYFFQTGVVDEHGNGVSSETVKRQIRDLIRSEDPYAPFSDQKLCERLKQQGIRVERRTVAKYRKSLGIGASSQRKPLT